MKDSMSDQFEQLKLLYQQILSVAQRTKRAIDNSDYDEALSCENYKSQLVSKLMLINKTVSLTGDEISIIDEIKKEILDLEKENLNIITDLRDKTMQELKTLNSQNKIANKYNQVEENIEGTICDYTSD